jgi:putative endonuclease
MEFKVYILFSPSLGKYYTGFTADVNKRLQHHNSGQDRFSKKGVPWSLIVAFPCENKKEAMALEKKIKSRGAARYLEDQKRK